MSAEPEQQRPAHSTGTPPVRADSAMPPAQGLYQTRFEHDSCGVNFVCHLKGEASHRIVELGLGALCRMQHRGALGAEENTGDGAGILLQVPDGFYRQVVPFDLPEAGFYATGIAFLPGPPELADRAAGMVDEIIRQEGLEVLGWRELPIDDSMIGDAARAAEPTFRQVFLAGVQDADDRPSGIILDRLAYVVRKRVEHELWPGEEGSTSTSPSVYFPSLSARTIIYKGMLTNLQLAEFFTDLTDQRLESALVLVHSRFSTNTFPSWPLAHPYRMVAHNGEINTVQGNRNWMRAREALMATDLIPGDIQRLFPICTPGASDTAGFDEALELLTLAATRCPRPS